MILKNLRSQLSFLHSRRNRILIFLTVIFLVMFELWLWSKDGIFPAVQIIRKDTKLSIYFDSYPIGEAQIEKATIPTSVLAKVTAGELNSAYFINEVPKDQIIQLSQTANWKKTIYLRNPFSFELDFQGNKPFVFFGNPYRHLNSGWNDPNAALTNSSSSQIQISIYNGIRWVCWLIMKPFPYISIIIIILFVLVRRTPKSYLSLSPTAKSQPSVIKFTAVLIFFCIFSFMLSRYLMTKYSEEVPHVPDAVLYIIQSKIIATGKLSIPFNQLPSFLSPNHYKDYFYGLFKEHASYMTIIYFLGHPLMLAIGSYFHMLAYIPPIVGAVTVGLTMLIVFIITQSVLCASIAGIIFVSSPFFQTQTIDFMSHNTAAFYILMSLIPVLIKRTRWYIVSGFFIGLLLQTRPLTFIPMISICALYELIEVMMNKKVNIFLERTLMFLIGFIPPLLLFFYYNVLSTSSPFHTSFSLIGTLNTVGFGSDFQFGTGILQGFTNLVLFSLFYFKNYFLAFTPLLISIVLTPWYGRHKQNILLLITLVFGIIGAWFFFEEDGIMYGPRYLYEMTPVFCILYGIDFYYLRKIFNVNVVTKGIYYILVFAILSQVVFFELQWFGKIKPEYEGIRYMPSTVQELKGFNYSDGRFKDLSNKYKGKKKVFIMDTKTNWWEFTGGWISDYPLTKSDHVFITGPTFPEDTIPNALHVDWNTLR